ncbi:hypothetical protein SAMN02745146_2744 [Hymenobacter daecheongensis DSM 21074]|uniref:Uncharacterized protein n=1 Tax=Hymenobacter daecheongensis DSM 21074 TaxID=1121955 RepID=A0A1M6I0Z0_9BACT|nr:hypothetical protein [Hymenobacter daecheongensis]SHJ28156.1 hypothetical protein SAMN02745146_2744 [Hymenobacter daecheongensis DSM 21074]
MGNKDLNAPAPNSGRVDPEIALRSTQITTRFLQEVDTLLAHGFAPSELDIARHLGVGRTVISEMRRGLRRAQLALARRLKDVYGADYHFILFGV